MEKAKKQWELGDAIKAAQKTIKVMEKYGKELESRLPAGITEGLKNDLATLKGSKVARPAFIKTVGAKTKSERAWAKDGADLLSGLRHALKVCPQSTPEVLKAVGVGSQVNRGKTSSVAESLTAMLDAAKRYVDVFRAAGILDGDLAEARAILDNLLSADEAQQSAIDTKTEMTAQKDDAQLRIEQAVATIAATGAIHFRKQAAKRAAFDKLLPKSKTRGGNGAGAPPAPAPH
jgi:hypothetical protein